MQILLVVLGGVEEAKDGCQVKDRSDYMAWEV
jgi:hypothetical protein